MNDHSVLNFERSWGKGPERRIHIKPNIKPKSRGNFVSPVLQGEAIRKVRERLGMTQEEFARALRVSQSTVQNWESGRTRPHRGTLARIEAAASPPRGPRTRRSRVSEETRLQLITALDTILDRAPSAVIEEISQILTERAGKYGEPR